MKISYRSHPIMKMLNDGKLGKFGICQEDSSFFREKQHRLDDIEFNFNLFVREFKSNIRIITDPFFDAIELSRQKLTNEEMFKFDSPESGSLFFPKGWVILYSIGRFKIGEPLSRVIFVFKTDILIAFSVSNEKANTSAVYIQSPLVHRYIKEIKQTSWEEAQVDFINDYFTLVVNTVLFIKYCPVETVHLRPHSKLKQFNCKYINDTGNDFTIYDSKWFTTFVKSDAFKVRLHLRWQPKKKDGQWTKELIWIDEYGKNGYTSRAKKLLVVD